MTISLKISSEPIEPKRPEPKVILGICSCCLNRWPLVELIPDFGYHNGWEMAPYTEYLCPKCPDGGCVDDYDYEHNAAETRVQQMILDGLSVKDLKHKLESLGYSPSLYERYCAQGWMAIWREQRKALLEKDHE